MNIPRRERWKAWSAAIILAGAAGYGYFRMKTDNSAAAFAVPKPESGGVHVSADLPTWLVIVGIVFGVGLGTVILAWSTRGNWRK